MKKQVWEKNYILSGLCDKIFVALDELLYNCHVELDMFLC